MKAGGVGRESKDICGLSKVENEGSKKAEKVKGESDNVLKKKKKKRAKERLHEDYKGFEKVVENREIAGKLGLGKIFNQSRDDHDVCNQLEKVESVKAAEKKEKRGREKFENEFARKGPQVGNLMRKVEKNNKKMEKLGRKKEGFAPIVCDGELWFDAASDLPKAGEGKLGVETLWAGSASVEVRKAEVK